ncbi:MAG: crotonase/enoyl-CoA hydratase family protein [Thermodesulfobacteriota bacterium]|nr:crotonase/enoyl-CoA hydratase family protein [Thermodesulfobacteriota bacterium]
MSGNDFFKVKKEGHIAWLILNRPEKRNSMNLECFSSLREIFPRFDKDPEVRVVVIQAEGQCFTGGLDLYDAATLIGADSADSREQLRKVILEMQESMNMIERCKKPVIAAAHGLCIGAGVDLLSACDIRVASKDALFSIRETKIAIIADLGTLQRLPTIIGHGWFRELALTGRNFTAAEALQMGFITHIADNQKELFAKAKKLAEEIAGNSPLAVQGAKEVILYSRDNGIYPGLEYVAQKNASTLPCDDVMEAFKAFMEKRPPEFKGK